MELTDKERKLIEKLRKYPFAKVVVVMHEGQPVRIKGGIKEEQL